MSISTKPFGTAPSGEAVTLYTMTNRSGASVSIIDYGAIVTSIIVPDRDGKLADVALGFDSMAHYGKGHGSMGIPSAATAIALVRAASPWTA